MHFSLAVVIAIVLAWGVLGLYYYCRERRRNQWRARWEDFVRRTRSLTENWPGSGRAGNGDSDPMILPHYSYPLAGLIPQARVKIYPDSAHGFLFQHHAEFAADVEAFLSDPS
jgi:pimeloyl-ACP methyl ester carboxylesterase